MLLTIAAFEVLWRKQSPNNNATESSIALTKRLALALLAISAISIIILWSSYGFCNVPRASGLPLNPTMDTLLHRVPSHFLASIIALFDKLHLLPQSYLYGLAHVLIQSKAFTSFARGGSNAARIFPED